MKSLNLVKRFVIGTALFLSCVWLINHPPVFWPLLIAGGLSLAMVEWMYLFTKHPLLNWGLGLLCLAGFWTGPGPLASLVYGQPIWTWLWHSLWLSFIGLMCISQDTPARLRQLPTWVKALVGMLIFLPIGWSLGLETRFAFWEGPQPPLPLPFPKAPLCLLCLVALGDVSAYLIGNLVGIRALASKISPFKTWEGLWGGLSCVLIATWMAALDYNINSAYWLLLAPTLLYFASVLGDLHESAWKRAAKVKESGCWFPGHGGLLDRMDSYLYVLPLSALYWRHLGPMSSGFR